MEDNPDLQTADCPRWEHHLTHYLKKYQQEQKEDQAEIESLKYQLTKLQLQEVRNKVNEDKKQEKVRQLVQQTPPQGPPPPLQPIPLLPPVNWQIRPPRWVQGRRGRGRGLRRGGGGRPGTGLDVCYNCGHLGHWRQACPYQSQQSMGVHIRILHYLHRSPPRHSHVRRQTLQQHHPWDSILNNTDGPWGPQRR